MSKKIETAKTPLRSLYQCSHAKVKGEDIYCAKGQKLSTNKLGTIHIRELIRGDPLELRVCQLCGDYDEVGPPIPDGQRGWDKEIKPFSVQELNLDTSLSNALRRAGVDTLEKMIDVCLGKRKARTIGITKTAELKSKLRAVGFEV